MVIEYKSVAVGGVSQVKDEGDGVVVAYVSVTGVEDNVKDIIEPGAYKRTLNKRTPKGVWSHSWITPTSKTLNATELKPGDSDLPKQLSDGKPWPKDAGALRIKMKFNLDTARGREAYSDVQFFGDQQEWSIGYTVPPGASYKDAQGRRHIKDLDLYEYSPVLFGAMSHARTAATPQVSVKDAQFASMIMHGVPMLEIKSLEEQIADFRKKHDLPEPTGDGEDFIGDETSTGEDEPDDAVPDDEDDLTDDEMAEEVADAEEKSFLDRITTGMSLKEIRTAYTTLGKLLSIAEPDDSGADVIAIGTKALVEAKATGFDSVADAVDAIDVMLEPVIAAEMKQAAEELDTALAKEDGSAAEDAAGRLMDGLEEAMDANEDDDLSLKAVARTISDKASTSRPGETDDDEDDNGDDWNNDTEPDDDEDDLTAVTDNRKKRMKSLTYEIDGVEYKLGPWAGRTFGGVIGGSELEKKDRVAAFIGCVPNYVLSAMNVVLAEVRGNVSMKRLVHDEIVTRTVAGLMSEQKVSGTFPAQRTAKKNLAKTKKTAKKTAKVLRTAPTGVQTKTRKNTIPGTDSFPINDVGELKDAIQAYGRAKDKPAAKKHIMARAKSLGHEELIPQDWKQLVDVDTTEIKTLEAFLSELT